MKTVKYYVYSIKYERIKEDGEKEKVSEDFFLREEERNYIYEKGSSKIYPNIFPTEQKHLFHAWNIPKYCIRSKHTYLCEEPTEERKQTEKLTAKDYKIEEVQK